MSDVRVILELSRVLLLVLSLRQLVRQDLILNDELLDLLLLLFHVLSLGLVLAEHLLHCLRLRICQADK